MEFFPENYKRPSSSEGYLKLQDGENKLRILSKPIIGWEDWLDNKPIRFTFDNKPLKPVDASKPIKLFYAFIVFNYNEERIQIYNVTQASIQKALESLSKDKDWGAPYFYDIKIIKSGTQKNTKYNINPLPHKPVHEFIVDQFADKPAYLPALFEGLDPFDTKWDEYTPGIFFSNEEKKEPIKITGTSGNCIIEVKKEVVSQEQGKELVSLLMACSPKYQDELMKSLRKPEINAGTLFELPIGLYDKVKAALVKNAEEFKKIANNDNLPF